MSSFYKLEEAQFFLELLDALENRSNSLTQIGDKAKEASFLFAAVLNSFYSTLAIMRDTEGVERAKITAFMKAHPEIYARSDKGGERAKTVHVMHTETAHSGYIPPPGDKINFNVREQAKLADSTEVTSSSIVLNANPKHYSDIELLGRKVSTVEFCYEHYYKLRTFHEEVKT